MSWLRTILREIYGLFVDDGILAVSILLWLAVMKLAAPRLAGLAKGSGLVLFGGLLFILAESALRYARRTRK